MDYVKALRQPNFTKLWGAQILSQVAQNLLNFALIIQVFNASAHTHFGNIAVSLLVLAFGVPSIFFAAFAGAMADRWNRRLVMIVTNTLRAGLVLLYIPLHNNLIAVLVLSFLISSIMQFFVPAEAATIPQVVPKESLLAANSLFVFSLYGSFIVGYGLAAPVITTFGEFGPYLLTGGMFALAGLMLLGLPRGEGSHRRGLPEFKFGEELRAGFRVVRAHRWLSLAIRQLTITQAIVGVIMALAPALSVALLHRELQHASTYLIIPAGIGMVVGVGMVGHLTRRWSKIRVLEIGLVVAGVALTLLGLSSLLYRPYEGEMLISEAHIGFVVAVLVFMLGMLNAIISSTAQTVLQENSSEEARGKVFGALKAQAAKLGVAEHVVFTGYLDEADKPAIYNAASLFVISSPAELQSIVLLEAMASALPVVAVDIAALKELCHDGENGYLFKADDAQGLAMAINRILASPDNAQRFGAASRAIVERSHSTTAMFDAYESIYQHVAKQETAS